MGIECKELYSPQMVETLQACGRIVVWGTGHYAESLFQSLGEKAWKETVCWCVDSAPDKQNRLFHGKPVCSPQNINGGGFDFVLIAICFWGDIYERLRTEFRIKSQQIDNVYFLQRRLLLQYYDGLPVLRDGQEKILSRLRHYPLNFAFNFDGAEYAPRIAINVGYDDSCGLHYSIFAGKRMYLSRRFSTEQTVQEYIRWLAVEQMDNSPHRYLTKDFDVHEGSVVLDAGVAEGNFSLSIIDKVSHLYLVEADEEWWEPLEYTFAPYRDKVTIIHGFLSDIQQGHYVTIDCILEGGQLDFLKLDIEGAEPKALYGGRQTICSQNVRMSICVYHYPGEEAEVRAILHEYGYSAYSGNDWMTVCIKEMPARLTQWRTPRLTHGVLYVKSEKLPKVCLYGTGCDGEIVYQSLLKDRCGTFFVADNDEKKQGTQLWGKSVRSLSEIITTESVDYVVITSSAYAHEMELACLKLGVDKERIIKYWDIERNISFLDATEALLRRTQILSRKLENAPYEYGQLRVPLVRPSDELLRLLINTGRSLSRFGDGEFDCMLMEERPWFQKPNECLANRLREVLACKDERLIIAIADNFASLDKYTEAAADGIRLYMEGGKREKIMRMLSVDTTYFDAYVTRPYIIYKDKSRSKVIFELFMELFQSRDILVIEGENNHFGYGNELLLHAKSVRRIRCPAQEAFSCYERILASIKRHANPDTLILISLGPTATVLTYDLALAGYQAIDIGQLDNEYDWYKMGVNTRVPIRGKGVAEVWWAHTAGQALPCEYAREVVETIDV